MSKNERVHIELTLDQARAMSAALDAYTRLAIGQMGAISNLASFGLIPSANGESATIEQLRDLEVVMDQASRALGFSPNSSLGIFNEKVSLAGKRSYEVMKVLDKVLAEHQYPAPSFRGVNYDGLSVRATSDPLPVAKIATTAPPID